LNAETCLLHAKRCRKMRRKKTLITLLLAGGTLIALALVIVALAVNGVVTPQQGLLLLVALFGMYIGFGVLIAVYRLVAKLE